jgi:hypothetical protein
MKRKFSGLRLEDAMHLIPAERVLAWEPPTSPRPPSDTLQDVLRRLHSFDLQARSLPRRC